MRKMTGVKKGIIIGIWVIILSLILAVFLYIPVNKLIYENRVSSYLMNEMEYDNEDIRSIDAVWNFKLPRFYVIVVFEDEPEVEYTYFAHNHVIQIEYRIREQEDGAKTKESELINYVPIY
ncbi:DUF3139 domain-containing protein [Evansella tamaricis]|uniref:DUF3139 domain-containing protein n=1 Tax=Evansella tamaricis TaxID=2069301 RepID=A0ABS6JE34_9BACI|nr:DUF3139 domain-containing protein [Evansella tamaricis]MBU9710603.1 DUF3139 domain-containing protein [Evansella tamaricis]